MPNIFVVNEPTAPRLSPSLAKEIGLNESIVLLQLEYWINFIGEERDGLFWVRRSLSELKEVFPFWSRQTLKRILDSLAEKHFVHVSDELNQWDRDKTRWYAINEKGCSRLNSIALIKVRVKDDSVQNETTLHPEYSYSKNIPKNVGGRVPVLAYEEAERMASAWASATIVEDVPDQDRKAVQLSLLPPDKSKTPKGIPKVFHSLMYRLCFLAESQQETMTLNSAQRGRVASVLGKLQEAGADLNKLNLFETWWRTHWRSKAQGSGLYQPPRPEQVLEFWWVSLKHGEPAKALPAVTILPGPEHLDELMKLNASKRRGGQ